MLLFGAFFPGQRAILGLSELPTSRRLSGVLGTPAHALLGRGFRIGVSSFNGLAHPGTLMQNVLHQCAPAIWGVLSVSTQYASTR